MSQDYSFFIEEWRAVSQNSHQPVRVLNVSLLRRKLNLTVNYDQTSPIVKKREGRKTEHYSIHMTSYGMILKCGPIVGTLNGEMRDFFICRSYERVSYRKIQLLQTIQINRVLQFKDAMESNMLKMKFVSHVAHFFNTKIKR